MKTLSSVLTNQKQRSTADWESRVARTSCWLCPHLCSSQRCCRAEHRGGVDVQRPVDLRRPLQLREFGVATPLAGVTAGASPLRCVTEPQRQYDPSVRPHCVSPAASFALWSAAGHSCQTRLLYCIYSLLLNASITTSYSRHWENTRVTSVCKKY